MKLTFIIEKDEEELKEINNEKELICEHLDSPEHKVTGCECQIPIGHTQAGSQAGAGPGPGPGPRSAEEKARRRDAERKAKAAAQDAARQAQQSPAGEAQTQSFEQAQKQQETYDAQEVQWKLAKAEALVFLVLCVIGWAGSGINATIHSWQAEHDRQAQQQAADEIRKNDPCQSGTSSIPPTFAQVNIKDSALQTSKLWRTNCKGAGQGAIVTGEDAIGRLVTGLYYGIKLSYEGQWLVSYGSSPDSVSVEQWNAANALAGRTIYTYDANHNLVEIRKLDAQLQPIIVATIERRPGGGFFATDMQFIGGNTTTKLYSPDDPQLTKNFYLCDIFGKIPKQIDPIPTATSPEITPKGSLTVRKGRPPQFLVLPISWASISCQGLGTGKI